MTEHTNVVAMPGYSVPHAQGEPVPEVVDICEELLALAKTGKLRAVAAALVEADPQIIVSIRYWSGPSPDRYCLMAAVSMLDFDIRHDLFAGQADFNDTHAS